MSGDQPNTPSKNPENDSVDNTDSAQDESTATRPLHIDIPQSSRRIVVVARPGTRMGNWLDNLENPPSWATVNEANALYYQTLNEQMRELDLELNNLGVSCRATYRHPPGYWNARRLRSLAQRFVPSSRRRWVHEQAMNIDLNSLNSHTFQQLLHNLFEETEGTWERVLVIFYFCTDLSLRALREKFVNHFVNIYQWTTVFISGSLSTWVENEGGWSVVLGDHMSTYITTATVTAALGVAIAICYVFLKRR